MVQLVTHGHALSFSFPWKEKAECVAAINQSMVINMDYMDPEVLNSNKNQIL